MSVEINQKKFIHSCEFVIRWGDMDGYGHVNNTTYFLYTQEARFKLMVDNGVPITPASVGPILASTSCKFIYPIRYPETIVVDTYFVGQLEKKILFEHIIHSATDSNKIYAILESVSVWFDFRSNKSIDPPEDALNKLLAKG